MGTIKKRAGKFIVPVRMELTKNPESYFYLEPMAKTNDSTDFMVNLRFKIRINPEEIINIKGNKKMIKLIKERVVNTLESLIFIKREESE
jgi:chromosome condensin MukBEF MukE localization factor